MQIWRADPQIEVPVILTFFLGQTSPSVNICDHIFKKDSVDCRFGVQGLTTTITTYRFRFNKILYADVTVAQARI